MDKENLLKLIDKIYEEKKEKNVFEGKPHHIIRTYSMGVFYGVIDTERSTETKKILLNARRVWYWDGAASLSELATEGTCKPENCKFPCVVEEIELTSPQGFEILKMTEKALKSLDSVKIWTAKT